MEKITNKSKAHTRYKLADGTNIPGTTTITNLRAKPQLVGWANRLGLQGIDSNKYTDEKADIGTCAHYMILCKLTGQDPDLDEYSKYVIDKAKNCLKSFYAWKEKHKIEVVHCERKLVSEKAKFGGTIDMVAMVDGVLEIVDFKTGKAIYEEHFYQLAGYEILLRDNGITVSGRRILNIPRSDDEVFVEKMESDRRMKLNEKIFLDLLDVYYCEKELKGE